MLKKRLNKNGSESLSHFDVSRVLGVDADILGTKESRPSTAPCVNVLRLDFNEVYIKLNVTFNYLSLR